MLPRRYQWRPSSSQIVKTKSRSYDHGFDQFLDEDEIDIKTFVLPQLPKCSICTLPFPFELDRTIFKQCCGNMVCRACDESTFYGELKRRLEEEHTPVSTLLAYRGVHSAEIIRQRMVFLHWKNLLNAVIVKP